MHDFKRLRVWQLASDLEVGVHKLMPQFPRYDRGIMATQLRRAAESIPANIAEGCGLATRKEASQFLRQASRSAREVESKLLQAVRIGFLHPRQAQGLLNIAVAIPPMLASLVLRLPEDPLSPRGEHRPSMRPGD